MPVSVDEFRRVMSRWTSGITVVTAAYQGQTHGMVASSFASVSADPISVLFCADHRTRTYPLVRDSGAFAVNILAQDQEEVFRVFAGQRSEREDDKFAGEEVITAATGSPILKRCMGWFDCRVIGAYPGGNTHTIFVGEVVAADLGAGAGAPPLVYFHRAVRQLADIEE
jgi:flavin reductase (DIM6/NTAB) family NADH-FMN oxidoreductase RutF